MVIIPLLAIELKDTPVDNPTNNFYWRQKTGSLFCTILRELDFASNKDQCHNPQFVSITKYQEDITFGTPSVCVSTCSKSSASFTHTFISIFVHQF